MFKMAGKESQDVLSFNPNEVKSKSSFWTILGVLTMMSVLTSLSLIILSIGYAAVLIPAFLIIQIAFAFIATSLLKWWKLRSGNVYEIGYVGLNEFVGSPKEEVVYRGLAEMCIRLGVKMPSIAIEETEEVNAFAIGMRKKNSLIVFTSALFDNLSEDEIIAIGAHELGHIQNGDVLGMTLAYSMQLILVNAISFPIKLIIYPLTYILSEYFGNLLSSILYTATCILIDYILFGITNLFVLAYSRRREFRADLFAAQIVGKECMMRTLHQLTSTYSAPITKGAMGINSSNRLWDMFSTHPSTDRRIKYVSERAKF